MNYPVPKLPSPYAIRLMFATQSSFPSPLKSASRKKHSLIIGFAAPWRNVSIPLHTVVSRPSGFFDCDSQMVVLSFEE